MATVYTLERPVFDRALLGRTVVAASDAATVLTAPQSIESIVTMTPTTGRNLTTATAALIMAELDQDVRVGSTFTITVVNLASATHAITFVPGTGATLVGGATIAAASSATFTGFVSNVGTPAVVFYRS